jgi:hypothetical protein
MSTPVLRYLLLGSVAAGFVLPLPIFWHQRVHSAVIETPPVSSTAVPAEVPADSGEAADVSLADLPFSATLLDAPRKARIGAATVQVDVRNTRLVDPDEVAAQPTAASGHLHYQVDEGPVVATTATKLSFHGLGTGNHVIKVTLAGHDHKPISPSQALNVTIPAS